MLKCTLVIYVNQVYHKILLSLYPTFWLYQFINLYIIIPIIIQVKYPTNELHMLGYSILILQILAICYATRAGTVPVAERNLKNILLFVSDDLRPEIGVYSEEEDAYYKSIKTPNIDGLAEESLVFKRAYTQVRYIKEVWV